MDIQSNISNNIKKYRKKLGLSQEALADELGVTSQAVSKWECMQSIPDIEMMVMLCTFFGIAMDKLILDKDPETIVIEENAENEMAEEDTDNIKNEEHYDRRGLFNKIYFDALPDDDNLRVLQFKGRRLLRENDYDPKIHIPLSIDNKMFPEKTVNVHIVGSADIEGDVSGSVNAGDSVSCGNVGASVSAGDSVNCGNVGNSVSAGDDVRCGDVNTITKCNGDIHCNNVTGKIQNCKGTVYVG